MAEDIDKVVRDFSDLLTSDDPIILQKLQIEVQLEAMRRQDRAMAEMNKNLGSLVLSMERIDWKLWEFLKQMKPELAKDE